MAAYAEFRNSNDVLRQPEQLRERAREDGYLFFRGLIDTGQLWNVRQEIVRLCAEAGWLAPGADPMEGIAAPGVQHIEGQPEFMKVYNEVMKSETFHRFAHQPGLIAMLDALFGEPTLVHARNIARIIFPQSVEHTTPPHQDYLYIEGTEETWTAWIPLGDCPREMGSLAILPGSHRQGLHRVRPSLGAGGHRIEIEYLSEGWAASDFQAGDVVLFHSMTVHQGLPNLSPSRLRLSVDYRYQPLSHPIVESSLRPHFAQVTWDAIYADWKSTEYQYYWQELPIHLVAPAPDLRRKLVDLPAAPSEPAEGAATP